MKGKKVGNNFEETSRKSRVKMHKSGKHWVRTVMSQIGLMRLFKGAKVEEVAISQVEETLKDEKSKIYNIDMHNDGTLMIHVYNQNGSKQGGSRIGQLKYCPKCGREFK